MSDAETVLELESTWGTAPIVGDLDTVAGVVADDWIGVAPTGQTMGKADLLEMLASHPNIFNSVRYSDVMVKIFGSTAVVTSYFEGSGELELRQRYLRVYAKRGETWQCVATQIAPETS